MKKVILLAILFLSAGINRGFSQDTNDSELRPESKNGIWYFHGKPKFMLGVHSPVFGNYEAPEIKPEGFDDPIYSKYMDKEIAQRFGIDTAAIWCEDLIAKGGSFSTLRHYISGAELSDEQIKRLTEERIAHCKKYYIPLDNMPLEIDLTTHLRYIYYDVFYKLPEGVTEAERKGAVAQADREARKKSEDSKTINGLLPKEILQQNNSGWHLYIPLCPENPVGKKTYEDLFRQTIENAQKIGVNAWIYELFNEATYQCACSYNQKEFREWLKKRHESIDALNKKWGTNLKSFEEIDALDGPGKRICAGHWVDWIEFTGDRYAEILRWGKEIIKSADKRKNVYVTFQTSWPCIADQGMGVMEGVDLYKTIKDMDVVGLEGGIKGGGPVEDNSSDQGATTDKAVQVNIGKAGYNLTMDMARSMCPDKPIMNFEYYSGRLDENNKLIPPNKEDFKSSLWHDLFHESAGFYFWIWHRCVTIKTKEQGIARANAVPAYELTNPYSVPLEALDGLKEFQAGLAKINDMVLPRPRIKGVVALLFSSPTRRRGPINGTNQEILTYYEALMGTHYPFDIIFEEQLPEGAAGKYKAIILPKAESVYNDTPKFLSDYVEKGGVLIANAYALKTDRYGNELDKKERESMLGVSIKNASAETAETLTSDTSDFKNIECRKDLLMTPLPGANVLAKSKRTEQALLTVKEKGKGKVYCCNGNMNSYNLGNLLKGVLNNAAVEPPFTITDKNDSSHDVETVLVDRGDKKLYYLRNWHPIKSKLVTLKINSPESPVFVCSPIDGIEYLSKEKTALWSKESLSKGISVLLKPQISTILLLSKEKFSENPVKQLENKDVEKDFLSIQNDEAKIMEKSAENCDKEKKEWVEKNTYHEVKLEKCFSVDISKFTNMSFKDETVNDKKGGMFDEGDNDMRTMPTGKQTFSGVPFNIINPESNNGTACIVLRGKSEKYEKNFLPSEIKGINVGGKLENLYFAHCVGWGTPKGKTVFSYIINYEDGTKENIPVICGQNVLDWWEVNKAVPDAKVSGIGKNPYAPVGFFVCKWKNPHPDKEIKTIDIISAETEALPCVIGITGER